MTGVEKRKTAKKTFAVFGYSLIFILFIYFIVNALFPKYTVRIFRFQHLIVAPASNSMVPVINPNDIVLVRRINPDNIKEGDIISFYVDVDNDGFVDIVTHYFEGRITGEDGKIYYETKNTQLPDNDPWLISPGDIIGKYVMRIPRAGKMLMFFRHPLGIATLIIGVATIYVVIYLIEKRKID